MEAIRLRGDRVFESDGMSKYQFRPVLYKWKWKLKHVHLAIQQV